MTWNIDSLIFISFLLANLAFGLVSSRGVKNIREFAIGNRNFSTATLVSTIVATWIGGSFFYTIINETYAKGLSFIWVELIGDTLCLLLIGVLFAPRMGEFLGKLSIADAMGELYGSKVRYITAISCVIGVSGIIAVQLRIATMIFEYIGISSFYGILISGAIVTIYSALGGLKSVTFTDVIQFITFSIVIPMVAYALLKNLGNINVITNIVSNSDLFDYRKVFDFSNISNLGMLSVFFCYAIPDFNPPFFQRVSIAKNVQQARKSFCISAISCFFLVLSVCLIGVLMLGVNPNIKQGDIMKHLIMDMHFISGFKGLLLSGVMAMILSTIDSYINSTAVIIVNDLCKPLGIKLLNNQLLSARIISLAIGTFAIIIAIYNSKTLLQLYLIAYSFYMPVITLPFIMTVLGFRTTSKSIILGMIAGFSTVIFWDYILQFQFGINLSSSVPIGMLANFIVLMGSHYLLRQKGGWVGIKDQRPLIEIRQNRARAIKKLLQLIKDFNLLKFLNKNSPKGDGIISILGFFVMIATFSSVNWIAKDFDHEHNGLLQILYILTLGSSSALISYPLWLEKWKNNNAIGIVWNIVSFGVLICFSFLMVLVSNFAEVQLMVFLINLIIISAFASWQWSLFKITLGVILISLLYEGYIAYDFSSQFKIVYLLMLFSTSLVFFLKPKQEYEAKIEGQNKHLGEIIEDRDAELAKSLALKQEFLKNLAHEARTPITGIAYTGLELYNSYNKLNQSQREEMLLTIAQSSDRLLRFVNNLIDVSKLQTMNYQLNKTKVNLSTLIDERIYQCKRLYLNNKELSFISNIEKKVLIDCDLNYITSTLDNLIINAIQYSKEGIIEIALTQNENEVRFSIKDQGIGIPKHELMNIFREFVVSSKTKTPAGGRGVGLAICKKTLEAHNGDIWAESDGNKGSTFIFTLPK